MAHKVAVALGGVDAGVGQAWGRGRGGAAEFPEDNGDDVVDAVGGEARVAPVGFEDILDNSESMSDELSDGARSEFEMLEEEGAQTAALDGDDQGGDEMGVGGPVDASAFTGDARAAGLEAEPGQGDEVP